MIRRRTVVLGLTVLLTAALDAGCGGPAGSGRPVAIPSAELPFSVVRTVPPTPTPSTRQPVTVFLVRSERLVASVRQVPRDVSTAHAAVQALLAGPTGAERLRGLETAIPAQTSLLELRVLDHVADIDLSGEFESTAPPQVILLRVAQVVWTLVADPDVTAVRFAIDGQTVTVATDNGVLVDRPVTAPDYGSVAPIP